VNLNISSFFVDSVVRWPDKTCVLEDGRCWSYAELDVEVRRCGAALSELGIEPGARVALLVANQAEFLVAYYGALRIGVIPVVLGAGAPPPEIAYFLQDSGAKALVVGPGLEDRARLGFGSAGTCLHLVLLDSKTELEGASEHTTSSLVPTPPDVLANAPRKPDDPAVILYTAGTTGRPKGAVLSHFNMYFFVTLLARTLWRLAHDDVLLLLAPADHIFGQAIINVATSLGAAISTVPKFDPVSCIGTMVRDRVSFVAGTPTIGHLLLSPAAAKHDLSSLRLVMLGGAATPPGMEADLRSELGVTVISGYGMTEAVPIAFVAEGMEVPDGSVGTAVWGTEVRVVDEDGSICPAGQPGEIQVRGPQVFLGYHNRSPEDAFIDGWLATGDVGSIDAAGHLFLIDRVDDLIKSGGYSVFPAEVERVLASHPAVAEAAVIGRPHPTHGQIVTAMVVANPGVELEAAELQTLCRQNLATYKCPRRIEIRGSLPKSPAGKVLRRKLREEATGDDDGQ
jgi:long-chain acyl-CoA synthetase